MPTSCRSAFINEGFSFLVCFPLTFLEINPSFPLLNSYFGASPCIGSQYCITWILLETRELLTHTLDLNGQNCLIGPNTQKVVGTTRTIAQPLPSDQICNASPNNLAA